MAAAQNNIPAVYSYSPTIKDGGLLSYGVDLVDTSRRAATYVDRILRGAKPGDLPVQFPTKFEMVVNLKIAKARIRARSTRLAGSVRDRVIETNLATSSSPIDNSIACRQRDAINNVCYNALHLWC